MDELGSKCENLKHSKKDCFDMFNCCDCGTEDENGCGCRYCFSCNACESCIAESKE